MRISRHFLMLFLFVLPVAFQGCSKGDLPTSSDQNSEPDNKKTTKKIAEVSVLGFSEINTDSTRVSINGSCNYDEDTADKALIDIKLLKRPKCTGCAVQLPFEEVAELTKNGVVCDKNNSFYVAFSSFNVNFGQGDIYRTQTSMALYRDGDEVAGITVKAVEKSTAVLLAPPDTPVSDGANIQISTQPEGKSVNANTRVTLEVAVTSNDESFLSFQWRKFNNSTEAAQTVLNSYESCRQDLTRERTCESEYKALSSYMENIVGNSTAETRQLVIESVTDTDEGYYSVTIGDGTSVIESSRVLVDVLSYDPKAVRILVQPQSGTVDAGKPYRFSVDARSGSGRALTYTWKQLVVDERVLDPEKLTAAQAAYEAYESCRTSLIRDPDVTCETQYDALDEHMIPVDPVGGCSLQCPVGTTPIAGSNLCSGGDGSEEKQRVCDGPRVVGRDLILDQAKIRQSTYYSVEVTDGVNTVTSKKSFLHVKGIEILQHPMGVHVRRPADIRVTAVAVARGFSAPLTYEWRKLREESSEPVPAGELDPVEDRYIAYRRCREVNLNTNCAAEKNAILSDVNLEDSTYVVGSSTEGTNQGSLSYASASESHEGYYVLIIRNQERNGLNEGNYKVTSEIFRIIVDDPPPPPPPPDRGGGGGGGGGP